MACGQQQSQGKSKLAQFGTENRIQVLTEMIAATKFKLLSMKSAPGLLQVMKKAGIDYTGVLGDISGFEQNVEKEYLKSLKIFERML